MATQDSTADYVAELSTVIADGQQEQQVRLPIASTAYIAPGSVFSISISEVSLQDLEGVYINCTYITLYNVEILIYQHKKALGLKQLVRQT